MSFSNQSSFVDRGSQRKSGQENAVVDENALKAIAARFDVEIIFRLKLKNLASIPACLNSCINITDLDLSGNALVMLEHLGGLTALKRLNLSSNRLQTLDGLWLRNAHISAEDGDRPRRVGLRKLTYLHLAGNLIDKLDGLRLDEMANSLPSLRSLYLQNFDRSLQNGVCRKNGYKESVLARLPNLSNLDGERDPRASSYHQVAAEVEGLIANPPPRVEIVLPSPSPWITDEDLRPVERSIEAEFESKVKKVVRSIDDCHALFEVVKSEIGKAQSRIFSSSSAN